MISERTRMMLNMDNVPYTGPFGPIVFAQNPLVYENGSFRFQTAWNEVCSYNSKYGKTNGTYNESFGYQYATAGFYSYGCSFGYYSGGDSSYYPTFLCRTS